MSRQSARAMCTTHAGLSKNEALARLKAANAPTSVVACDNSPTNVTISGLLCSAHQGVRCLSGPCAPQTDA